MTIHFLSKQHTWEEISKLAAAQLYDVTISWENSFLHFIQQWNQPNDNITVNSSGSTGIPKKIDLAKSNMIASAKRTLEVFNIPPHANLLLCMDCRYIGAMMMVVRAIVNQSSLTVVAPQQLETQTEIKQQFDFAAMVPIQLENLLDSQFPIDQYFKKIILGGGSISTNLQNKIKKQIHITEIYETYGMTETISHIAYKPYDADCFTLMPQVEIKRNAQHCLVLRDHFISKNWIATNDIIEIENNKTYRYVGRYDFIINSGGIKINPEKIEKALSPFIDSPILCIGKPDEKFGEKLILLVESELQTIDDSIFEHLPQYERPKEIHCIKAFSYLPNQKINRKETAALFLKHQGI